MHRRKAVFELTATVHKSETLYKEQLHAKHLNSSLNFRLFLKEPEDLVNL